MLGQLSEFLWHATQLGEHDPGVAGRITAEPGSNRVERPVERPAS